MVADPYSFPIGASTLYVCAWAASIAEVWCSIISDFLFYSQIIVWKCCHPPLLPFDIGSGSCGITGREQVGVEDIWGMVLPFARGRLIENWDLLEGWFVYVALLWGNELTCSNMCCANILWWQSRPCWCYVWGEVMFDLCGSCVTIKLCSLGGIMQHNTKRLLCSCNLCAVWIASIVGIKI